MPVKRLGGSGGREPAAEFRRAEDGREGRGAARLNVRGAAAYGDVQRGGSAVQLCEKKKRMRERGQGKACQLRQGPTSDQGCSISSLRRGGRKGNNPGAP